METVQNTMQVDVAKLVGSTLRDICIRTFCVELIFLETMTITVRIKKRLKFALRKDAEFSFDPTLRAHEPSIESANFVFLQGMRCHRTVLTSTKFEVTFASDARLWVDLTDADFEPLELIGASGERHEKLQFYYVL